MGSIDPQHMQKLYEKWNALFITGLLQIGNKKLSLRKKRFYISMKAEEYLVKQGFSLWNIMDESEKADIEVNNLSDILNFL